MWADWQNADHRHFYIKELAQLIDNSFVIPMRWIRYNGSDHAQIYEVTHVDAVSNRVVWLSMTFNVSELTVIFQVFVIHTDNLKCIPASKLRWNVKDILQREPIDFSGATKTLRVRTRTQILTCVSELSPSWTKHVLNPYRLLSQGRPMFTIRLMPWCDGVSGNVSKQYNPHTNIYVANASLPHRKLTQEYFIRFSSTSPHATALEQFTAFTRDLYVFSLSQVFI